LALGLSVFGAPACGGSGDAGNVKSTGAPQMPTPPYARPSYQFVSETGIYSDLAALTLDSSFEPFAPNFVLWADGAEKSRFISLPPGQKIDTSELDHWVFPVGTRVVKEFRLDGVLLETRLIERYGKGREDYWFGSFIWSEDGTDAEFAVDGAEDVLGTPHDVPAQKQCWSCHNGDVGRVLGFSALQLARAPKDKHDLTLDALEKAHRLSDPPARGGESIAVPGDETTAAAFGYLHANCGHCHNENGTAWPDTQMVLRLDTGETVAEESKVYQSLVGQKLQYFRDGNVELRVAPGEPDASGIIVRMSQRGATLQMPPLGTEVTDPTGIDKVSAWISALPSP
jgi:hypothetical protein